MTALKTKPFKVPREVRLRVGVLEPGAAHEGGTTVGEIAETHEFGKGTAPERSFIRAWFDEHGKQASKLAREQFAAAVKTGRYSVAAERVAVKVAAEMRNRITEGIEPGLAESTEKAKARRGKKPPYTPLVDSGVLRSSIVGEATVAL